MHILGTVFAWLTAVATVAAIVLTTMLLDVRNKWLTQVQQKQTQVAQSTTELADLSRKVRQLEEELQRATHAWGEVWSAPNSGGPLPGSPGMIAVGVGTSRGLSQSAAAQNKALDAATYFVFNTNNAGESQYMGEFRIAEARADQAAMKLARDPYPGEVESWTPGNYRVRDLLPGNWTATTADLEGQWLIATTQLRTQQNQLEILNRQIQVSQAALDQRLAELNGKADAPPGASQEVVDGLVQTLRDLETKRNANLATVDNLRRQLDTSYVALRKTLDANRQAAADLNYLVDRQDRAPDTQTAASNGN